MIAPNNKAALTPPCQALQFLNNQPPPSPIAHKEKTTPRGVQSVVFILYSSAPLTLTT